MSFIDSLKFVAGHPLNRNRRVQALLRVLRWQVASRLVPGQIVCEWVDGTRFLANRGETGLTGNIYCGLHELAEMSFVLHALAPGDCFVDVGANVGSYTLLAAGVRKANVHSFEPVPSTFRRLMDNVRLNDLEDRVTAYNRGVSDGEGELKFSTRENCMNHVVGATEDSAGSVAVLVTSLDSALQGKSADMIKIDVEGYEAAVLAGARNTLSNPSLHSVVMEVNASGTRYGFSDEALLSTMKGLGFEEYAYDPFTRTLARTSKHLTREGNSIFVRDYDRVARRIASAPQFSINGHRI